MGTLFVGLFGLLVAYEEYFGEHKYYRTLLPAINSTSLMNASTSDQLLDPSQGAPRAAQAFLMTTTEPAASTDPIGRDSWSSLRHGCIVFEMLSTAGIFLAIGALTCWHVKLITDGETCVETHINKKERTRLSRLGFSFKNPYHVSPRENWINFLGFNQPDRGWRHVLFPSTFAPNGDGLTWHMSGASK